MIVEFPKYVFHQSTGAAVLVQDADEEQRAVALGFADTPAGVEPSKPAVAPVVHVEEFPKYVFRGQETRLVQTPKEDVTAKIDGFLEHPNDLPAPVAPDAVPVSLNAPAGVFESSPNGIVPVPEIAPFVPPVVDDVPAVALTPAEKRKATWAAKKAKK
ncbi:MAG: hypothetical protein NUW22_07545 [Acidobacteria bacterium]|nr:hypothetical protein [Acidobacteriota bacterium]